MSIIIDKGAAVAGLGCYTVCDADEDLLYRQNGRRVRIPVTRRGVGLFLEQQLQILYRLQARGGFLFRWSWRWVISYSDCRTRGGLLSLPPYAPLKEKSSSSGLELQAAVVRAIVS